MAIQRDMKVKVGQIVLIPAKIKDGMFPTERYFYWEIAPGNNISGYVVRDQIQNYRVRAVSSASSRTRPSWLSLGSSLEIISFTFRYPSHGSTRRDDAGVAGPAASLETEMDSL